MPTPPNLEYAFTLHATLAPPQDFGLTNVGWRRYIPITGGTFAGPKLKGTILPGGGDWNVIRPDGVVHVLAKYTIQCVDDATGKETLIYVTNEGYGRAGAETLGKIFGGTTTTTTEKDGGLSQEESEEEKKRAGWYVKTWPRFEVAGDSKHAWLNKSCFLGDLLPSKSTGEVKIDVYEVM